MRILLDLEALNDQKVWDASEYRYIADFSFKILPVSGRRQESSVTIERHLHHFYDGNKLERRVLKYWIPVNFSSYRIERDDERELSKFYRIDDDEVVCMY